MTTRYQRQKTADERSICDQFGQGIRIARIAKTMKMTPREVRGVLERGGVLQADAAAIRIEPDPMLNEDPEPRVSSRPAKNRIETFHMLPADTPHLDMAPQDFSDACDLHLQDLIRVHGQPGTCRSLDPIVRHVRREVVREPLFGRVDLTAAILGDPPAGRSALAQRGGRL